MQMKPCKQQALVWRNPGGRIISNSLGLSPCYTSKAAYPKFKASKHIPAAMPAEFVTDCTHSIGLHAAQCKAPGAPPGSLTLLHPDGVQGTLLEKFRAHGLLGYWTSGWEVWGIAEKEQE